MGLHLQSSAADRSDGTFINAVIIPLVLLDLFVTIFQAACFPAYGIPKVKRSEYLVFDRSHLGYLNALQKRNCAYCSYANGLIAYVREIASRIEQYWCPIKHAKRLSGVHSRYAGFVEFGDAEGFAAKREQFARDVQTEVAGVPAVVPANQN